jgi:hypothetical protein
MLTQDVACRLVLHHPPALHAQPSLVPPLLPETAGVRCCSGLCWQQQKPAEERLMQASALRLLEPQYKHFPCVMEGLAQAGHDKPHNDLK